MLCNVKAQPTLHVVTKQPTTMEQSLGEAEMSQYIFTSFHGNRRFVTVFYV